LLLCLTCMGSGLRESVQVSNLTCTINSSITQQSIQLVYVKYLIIIMSAQ